MNRSADRSSWLLFGGATALGPLAMGVHVPGIGDIAAALGETAPRVQLSVPVFILALGFGMFGAGDLVDRHGLRFALGGGLLIFTLGAFMAGSSTGLPSLLVGRALMGAGAAFAIVAPRVGVAIDATHATSGLARLAAVQSAVPALAPLLGTALVARFGWRATFLLPGCAAAALLVATALALPPQERAGSDRIVKPPSSHAWLGSRGWIVPSAEIALVTCVFLVLLAHTSTLLVRPFDLDPAGVGLVLASAGAAFVVGSVVLARATKPPALQRAARVAFFVGMVLLSVGAFASSLLVWTLGLVVYALANGILVPAAFGAVASFVPASKGRALGASGAIQMLAGAAAGAGAHLLGGLTPVAFGVGGAAVAAMVLGLSWIGTGGRTMRAWPGCDAGAGANLQARRSTCKS